MYPHQSSKHGGLIVFKRVAPISAALPDRVISAYLSGTSCALPTELIYLRIHQRCTMGSNTPSTLPPHGI